MFRRTIKRLAALYLAAAVLFLLGCGVGCAAAPITAEEVWPGTASSRRRT